MTLGTHRASQHLLIVSLGLHLCGQEMAAEQGCPKIRVLLGAVYGQGLVL